MILESAETALCNEVFSALEWLELIQPISEQLLSGYHQGTFKVQTSKEQLIFEALISEDFPLSYIFFKCQQILGYSHVSPDGVLCLHAPPADGITGRLELELAKLRLWIDKYYINEEEDERFEYLQFAKGLDPTLMIFEEDHSNDLINDNHGVFTYHLLTEKSIVSPANKSFVVADIGGRDSRWSQSFKQSLSRQYFGIWLTLQTLPVVNRRLRIEKWNELLGLLTAEQTQFLYGKFHKNRGKSDLPDRSFLMIGYRIPDADRTQWNWDLIIIKANDFPFKGQKVAPNEYRPLDLGKKIQWARTENASYTRMFGRGKLNDHLTGRNIFIIGTGAIGSNLLTSLVRGGCRQITIVDADTIGTGNACRGYFGFTDAGKSKTDHLKEMALRISPHLELKSYSVMLPSLSKSSGAYTKLKQRLMEYDYILDCSTDKYISIMLDKMQLKGQVLNFSISNGASHLVMATGFNNITAVKNAVYNRIAPGDNEPFFEGTGCWHPTFEASYSDLNVLVANAVNEINLRITSNMPINSFVINRTITETNKLVYETDYSV